VLLPYPLRRLAQLALLRGDAERATQLCLESLALNRDVGDPQGIAACLVGLAAIAAATHQSARAARLLGGADALLTTVQTQLFPLDRQQFEQSAMQVRTLLSASAFDCAWTDGRRMDLEALLTDIAEPAAGSARSLRPATGE
jgi:hypothetical protein